MIATRNRPAFGTMAKKEAKRAGRPTLPESVRRESPIPIRLTPEENAIITQAAEAEGAPLSTFIRGAALAHARRVLGLDR